MNPKIFTALAVLKVNSDKGFDYIDSFVRFCVHILKVKDYTETDISRLISDFEEQYGFVLPYYAVVTILNRCRKRGYVYRENNKFYVDKEKVLKDDFSIESSLQDRKINELIASFKQYVESLNIGLSPADDDCEVALLSFIRDHNSEILASIEGSSTLPIIPVNKKILYLLSKYIEKIFEEDVKKFDYLLDLSFGQALADTIICEDFTSYVYNLKGLNCYLDANLIFGLLGIDGPLRQSAYEDFLNKLIECEVDLFMFSHTYEEIMGILKGCLKWLEHPLFDPLKAHNAILFFIKNDKTKSDVELFISQIDTILSRFKIQVQQKPSHDTKARFYEIDEVLLRQKIEEKYSNRNSLFVNVEEGTINKDIDSIASIYKLRKGVLAKSLKSASYVFITTNASLARAVKEFNKEHFNSFSVSACLTDVFVGTMLWINNPQKYREMNKKKFLADAVAAAKPSKLLIKRYLVEIKKLRDDKNITDDQYFLLRSEVRAIDMLSKKTFNSLENFEQKTPKEILSDLQREEAVVEKSKHAETIKRLESKEQENVVLKQKNTFLSKRIEKVSRLLSRTLSYATTSVLSPIILTGSFAPFLPQKYRDNFFISFAIVFLLFFGLFSLLFGTSLRSWKERIEKFSYDKIIDLFSKPE